MKHDKLTLVVAFLCALAFVGPVSSVHAAQITNVSASASSYLNAATYPIYAVNGAGLSGNMHTNAGNNYVWLSKSGDIDGAYFIIDLEKNYKLDSTNTLKVWNYNATVSMGIKAATFSYSMDSVIFTEETNATTDATNAPATFDQATGLNTYSNYNTVAFNTSPMARYIKITVEGGSGTGNYGAGADVGLSEVQAFGAFVSDPTNSLGAQITVSNVSASSSYSADYSPTNLIDGSGLSGLAHDTDALNMWITANGVTNASVDFDLGVSRKLGAVRIWNNNEAPSSFRGMRTVDILVSDDATFTTGVTTNYNDIELLMPSCGLQDYDNPQILDMNGVEGGYVRITNVGNSDPSWHTSFAALSEVQFFLFVPPPPPSGTLFCFQ